MIGWRAVVSALAAGTAFKVERLMEKLENIDLAKELAEVRDERLFEQRRDVRKAINGIYMNLHSWQRQKAEAEKQAAKLSERIAKAQAALERIQNGDWSALPEEKKDGKPSTEEPP